MSNGHQKSTPKEGTTSSEWLHQVLDQDCCKTLMKVVRDLHHWFGWILFCWIGGRLGGSSFMGCWGLLVWEELLMLYLSLRLEILLSMKSSWRREENLLSICLRSGKILASQPWLHQPSLIVPSKLPTPMTWVSGLSISWSGTAWTIQLDLSLSLRLRKKISKQSSKTNTTTPGPPSWEKQSKAPKECQSAFRSSRTASKTRRH